MRDSCSHPQCQGETDCVELESSTVWGSSTTEDTPLTDKEDRRWFSGIPKRLIFTIMGFLGCFNIAAMRSNLNVAMVAMVRPSESNNTNMTFIACSELLDLPAANKSVDTDSLQNEEGFEWDANTQNLILGAFFYGYIITQVPGGILTEKFGGKWVFVIGVISTSAFTILTPPAANLGAGALVALRILEGFGEGITMPAINALIGLWAPKIERSRISAIIFSGIVAGNVVSLGLSGIISDALGWPSVFYIFGSVGFVWSIFWLLLVHDGPEKHPTISKSEKIYIQMSQEQKKIGKKIPWKAIITSRYVWALIITHFGNHWGYYTILTEMPTYLSKILHFNLKEDGVLSALPQLVQFFVTILGSFMADKMRSSNRFRINTIRKLCNSLAFFGPSFFLIIASFIGCRPYYIIVFLTLSVGISGFQFSGFSVTHVDMSPEYAGILMGITSCVGNIAGFLAPAFAGLITENGQTILNWRIVFLTSSTVLVVTGLVYDFFGTAEPQLWEVKEPSQVLFNPKRPDVSLPERDEKPTE